MNEERMKAPERARESADPLSPKSFALWYSTLGPPLIWGAYLLLGDGLYELGCSSGFRTREIYGLPFTFWYWVLVLGALAAVIVGGVLAYGAWRRIRRAEGENPTKWGRAQTMAVAGMASCFLYGLLILYGALPVFLLHPCSTSP
jgi:hypothetical protein